MKGLPSATKATLNAMTIPIRISECLEKEGEKRRRKKHSDTKADEKTRENLKIGRSFVLCTFVCRVAKIASKKYKTTYIQ